MDENNSITTTGGQSAGHIQEAAAIAREGAEIQAAVVIAKRFPRNQIQAIDRIKAACARPGLAATACYSYSRGGAEVTGPSIRLAEAMAQAWGNLQFGVRELEQRAGESTVEAFAWDLESNTKQSKIFQVRHERHTKAGTRRLEDPRDIYELVANQGARRVRACILGVLPGDVVEDAVAACEATLTTKAEATPERIKAMVDAFAALGISKRQIEARIQRHIDAITPAMLIGLGKIYNSVKDGMSSAADWFPPEQAPEEKQKGAAGVVAAIKARKGAQAGQEATDFPGMAKGPDGPTEPADGADGVTTESK